MEQGVALLLIGMEVLPNSFTNQTKTDFYTADCEFVNSLMWLHSLCSNPSTAIE
jgi:hypothetical protein